MSIKLETGTVTLSSETSATITFSLIYDKPPSVVLSSDDSDGNGGDVNCFVDSVSTTEATISTSAVYTGNIQYHVMSRK